MCIMAPIQTFAEVQDTEVSIFFENLLNNAFKNEDTLQMQNNLNKDVTAKYIDFIRTEYSLGNYLSIRNLLEENKLSLSYTTIEDSVDQGIKPSEIIEVTNGEFLPIPRERVEKRKEEAEPLVSAYFEWIREYELSILPKSLLGKAFTYAKNQQANLRNYLKDGRLEISNNRAERSIKPFVIGRKNWLFANTPAGANSSAIIYSIVETAKENGLNPFPYLEYLLESIPNLDKNGLTLEDMLPWSKSLPDKCRSKIIKK